MSQILSPAEFVAAIGSTTAQIKLLDCVGRVLARVSPADASALAGLRHELLSSRDPLLHAYRGRYEARGTLRRVKILRELDARPVERQAIWQPCWRTEEASVFPPAVDYWPWGRPRNREVTCGA